MLTSQSSYIFRGRCRGGVLDVAGTKFFEERSDQSEIKARIVQKYFFAWAKVIIPTAKKHGNKIAYIDLYAGPGRYRDGAASTPLLVLEGAIADPDMPKMLVTLFNDVDENHSQTLREEISKLSGIKKLNYKPVVQSNAVAKDAEEYFSQTRIIPSFTFFDPFGYKGLSLGIIRGVIKDWGCDCVFFFNYSRINAGVSNPIVDEHMRALFGEERIARLRLSLADATPTQRESIVLEELAQAIKGMGGRYVLPFRFKNATGTRTSHCLVFVSKHPRGYSIMKGIMAAESSVTDQGVPSFTYCPADASTPLLFSLAQPLNRLEGALLQNFSGQELTMEEVFARHNVDTPYIERNYKDALRILEAKGKIVCTPPAKDRQMRKGEVTFANAVRVRFPRAGK